MTCEIKASYDSPIVNPCFVVKNWKQKEAKVPVVGQQPENVKIGNPSMVTDKDMVVWLKLESEDKVKIIIEQYMGIWIYFFVQLGKNYRNDQIIYDGVNG